MRARKLIDSYDDEVAVQSYLETYWDWYMTDFEKKCRMLGARQAKALLNPASNWSQRVRREWEQAGDEARLVLECGLSEFERQIRERVLKAFREGVLLINRCPRCRRLVRTPLAQQCLWCGHDWHS